MIMDRYFFSKPIIVFMTLMLVLQSFLFRPSHVFALSIEDEKEMGRQFVLQIKQHFELLDDDYANQYFNSLGQFLTTSLDTKHFPFKFYIIKDKTLNAFAAPGGHIFFFSGLINTMDNADELASILCHEIGHVSARHMSKRMELGNKVGIGTLAGVLAGVLVGGPAAGALIMGSMAAGQQLQLAYSREDERQADQLGFKYMKSSNFDPSGLISTLKKIEQASMMGSDQIPTYLRTHPKTPERMSNLDSMLSYFTPDKPSEQTLKYRELFPIFQTIVRAKSLDSGQAEELFKDELKKNPQSATASFGLGIVYSERLEYDKALPYLEKAKTAMPDFVPVLTILGETYQMNGDDQKAIIEFEKGMQLDETSNSIPFHLGVSYENLEKYDASIRIFERLTYFAPVKDEVYYHLGISYGKINKLVLAHYNFGIFFQKIGELRKSMFHFNKALEFAEGDPAMREKIKKEQERFPADKRRLIEEMEREKRESRRYR